MTSHKGSAETGRVPAAVADSMPARCASSWRSDCRSLLQGPASSASMCRSRWKVAHLALAFGQGLGGRRVDRHDLTQLGPALAKGVIFDTKLRDGLRQAVEHSLSVLHDVSYLRSHCESTCESACESRAARPSLGPRATWNAQKLAYGPVWSCAWLQDNPPTAEDHQPYRLSLAHDVRERFMGVARDQARTQKTMPPCRQQVRISLYCACSNTCS